MIGGQNGASNRNGAARTLRAQKQLTRTQRPRLKAARRSFQARARLHRERHPKCKKKTPRPGSRQWTAQILTSARHDLLRTRLGQPAPGQCRLASWFTSRLHPALVLIQVRILCVIPWDGQTVAIGIRPPAVPLLSLAEFPARNPKSKVPRPGEHCQGGGSGRWGHDLTGAEGPYHDEAFRAIGSPDLRSGPSFAFSCFARNCFTRAMDCPCFVVVCSSPCSTW